MGKVLTQAQKTFTDLYDSYVLNLSSDIVAVPCDQDGKAIDKCEVTITYSASVGTQSVGVSNCAVQSDIPTGVTCNVDTIGTITITVAQGVELDDDYEIGFTFTTSNDNAFTFTRYITFIKVRQGADGENARSFQIKSEQGDTFTEGISEITMTTVALDGTTEITGSSYAWSYYDKEKAAWKKVPATGEASYGEDEDKINGHSEASLTVKKTDVYADSVFRCVITYSDGETDEDYYQLKLEKYNYESTVKFFSGTNTMSSSDPFLVAYVDLYKDYQKEDVVEAEYYYYHENSIKDSSGTMRPDFSKVEDSYKVDGNLMYVIYEDMTVSGGATSDTYTISTNVSPANTGTVIGGGTYEHGANIPLTAVPKDGYEFVCWADSDGSTNNPRTITVTGNATYTASFAVATTTKRTLTVSSSNSSMGSARIGSSASSGEYEKGTVVTITATANSGYEFVDWYEDGIAQNWPKITNVKVDKTRSLTAHFRRIASGNAVADTISAGDKRNIYVYKNDRTLLQFVPEIDGRYKFYLSENFKLNVYLYNSYEMILQQSLNTEEPEITYVFQAGMVYYFGVDISEYENNSAEVEVFLTTDTSDTDYTVTLQANNAAMCEALYGGGAYPAGTTATIMAIPNVGCGFVYWQDDREQKFYDQTYNFLVTREVTMTAVFQGATSSDDETTSFHIGALVYPNDACGSVSGDGVYDAESSVTLTASPNTDDGYEFVGWYIGDEFQTNSNPYTFSANRTVTYSALFEAVEISNYYTITTDHISAGGTVTVEGGVKNDEGKYKEGSQVVFVANPAENWIFNGWYDDNGRNVGEHITLSCAVANNMYVYADFEEQPQPTQYQITVQASPTNGGTVGGGGIFDSGTTTMIAAEANDGYEFTGWQDGNTASWRAITVTGNKTYTANFATPTVYHTITTSVSGSGSILVNGAVVSGTETYKQTTYVSITAQANTGHKLVAYGINEYANNNPTSQLLRQCYLVEDLTVWAYFEEDKQQPQPTQYQITVQASPTNGGTVGGGGIFDSGTTTMIAAEANDGYEFTGWQDGNKAAWRTITVTGTKTYTANFATPTVYHTIATSVSGSGSILVNGEVVSGTKDYAHLTSIRIVAQPASGYKLNAYVLDGKSYSAAGNTLVDSLITKDIVIHADFELDNSSSGGGSGTTYYTITANASPANGGQVGGGGTYEDGTITWLAVQANDGYEFTGWQDGDMATWRPITVTGNKTYTAYFTYVGSSGGDSGSTTIPFTITAEPIIESGVPANVGTVQVYQNGTRVYGSGNTYNLALGAQITLKTQIASGYSLYAWMDMNTHEPIEDTFIVSNTSPTKIGAMFVAI